MALGVRAWAQQQTRMQECAFLFDGAHLRAVSFVAQQPPPDRGTRGAAHNLTPSALARTACTSGQRARHTHARTTLTAMSPKAKASKRESGEEVLTRIAIVSADR